MTQFVLNADPVLFWQLWQWHSACGADSANSHTSGADLLTTNEGSSWTSILIAPQEQLPLCVIVIMSLKVAPGLDAR